MTFNFPPHIGIDARMYASSFTGIGRYVHELSAELFRLRPNWRFTLFLAPEVYTSFTPPHENVQKVLAPEPHYSLSEQISLLRRIQKQKCDLVHFPHFNAPLFFRGNSVVTIHDLTISFFPGKKKTSWLHTWGYKMVLSNIVRKAKRVITVSEHTKQDLQTLFHTPAEKIRVIWNGLNADFLRHEQNTSQINADWHKLLAQYNLTKPYFLYTGVHREHKNVVGMIEAFAKFVAKIPEAMLVITGKVDPFYPEVAQTITKLGLTEKIKTVGLVNEDELKALFYQARAFVFPSFYEGFGLPPLEAMAMQVPVIASNVSAIPEICGPAALYFDPYHVDDMAEKMSIVFHDEAQRNTLVQKGLERITLFSWEKMAAETVRVYEEALENT